jgi:uncharacterized protein YpbB
MKAMSFFRLAWNALVPFISSRQKRKLQFLPVLSEAVQRIILSWISDLLNTKLSLDMGDELALLADRWTDFKLVEGRRVEILIRQFTASNALASFFCSL